VLSVRSVYRTVSTDIEDVERRDTDTVGHRKSDRLVAVTAGYGRFPVFPQNRVHVLVSDSMTTATAFFPLRVRADSQTRV